MLRSPTFGARLAILYRGDRGVELGNLSGRQPRRRVVELERIGRVSVVLGVVADVLDVHAVGGAQRAIRGGAFRNTGRVGVRVVRIEIGVVVLDQRRVAPAGCGLSAQERNQAAAV